MSYPKIIVHSTIEGECLSGRECFRYKKIVILMGSLREFVKHPNRTFKRLMKYREMMKGKGIFVR